MKFTTPENNPRGVEVARGIGGSSERAAGAGNCGVFMAFDTVAIHKSVGSDRSEFFSNHGEVATHGCATNTFFLPMESMER